MQVTVDLLYQEIGKLHITDVVLRHEVTSLEQDLLAVKAEAQRKLIDAVTTQDDPKEE